MFQKAERRKAKLRLALTGPSGSGKTYSALLVASGIGGKIAVVDTENHSAELYAGQPGIPGFDTLQLEAPYSVEKYVAAIKGAEEAGYDVLVIDSITHAWAGEGGLLAQKELLDGRGGNSYTNWSSITKKHEEFKAWLLKCGVHLIVTMRSKQDYVIDTNEKGKSAPRKVGMAPIQREGMEYEFSIVLDLGMNHSATVSKTRFRDFDGKVFVPTKATGEMLLTWLNDGKDAPPPSTNPPTVEDRVGATKTINPREIKEITAKDGGKAAMVTDLSGEVFYMKDPAMIENAEMAVKNREKLAVIYDVKNGKNIVTDAIYQAVAKAK